MGRLAFALVAAVITVIASSAVAAGEDAPAKPAEAVIVDLRIWEHREDPEVNYVSARPASGSWKPFGTIRLPFDDGLSEDGLFHYDDITIPARARSGTAVSIEIRIWERIDDPIEHYISARRAGGDWAAFETTYVDLFDGYSKSYRYRYGDVTVRLPPRVSPPPPVTLHYNSYDTTGAVATAGSHALLTNTRSTASAADNFVDLYDATALLVNMSDSAGVSHAAIYESIEVGDVVEWVPVRSPDCWKRYRVKAILPDPPGDPPRKLLAVKELPEFLDECPARYFVDLIGEGGLQVELRWHPPPTRPGSPGRPPVMLQDQPVPGGATYRVAPHSPLVIDVPAGMRLMRFTGFVLGGGRYILGLQDVVSGSLLHLDLNTGEELSRDIRSFTDDSRDVSALFDRIASSAR